MPPPPKGKPGKGSARLRLGAAAEAEALAMLTAEGLELIAANWRGPGRGEIDLVMRDGEIAVIVEVRAQDHTRAGFAGHPAYTIGPDKRRRIATAAHHWLAAQRAEGGWQARAVRFDVVTVLC